MTQAFSSQGGVATIAFGDGASAQAGRQIDAPECAWALALSTITTRDLDANPRAIERDAIRVLLQNSWQGKCPPN